MAINRYSKLTPLQHTGSFFELPAEMLKSAVMARQEQYDAQQEAYDTYLTAIASMEMLPQDIAVSEEKKQTLMTKEKVLRDQFSGDITAPGYAQQFADILRADATDPFYRKATFNLAQTKQWQKGIEDYVAKEGVAPAAWQDPFGSTLSGYKGAIQSELPLYTGIQKNIQFQPYVIENHMQPYLKREIEQGRVKLVSTADGGGYYVNSKEERLTEEDIYRVLLEMNLHSSDAYKVLKAQWDNDPTIKSAEPNFNTFYDKQLKGIAAQLAYQTKVETFAGNIPTATGNNPLGPNPNGNGDNDLASNLLTAIRVSGATNPLAFESRNQFAVYRSSLMEERSKIMSTVNQDLTSMLGLGSLPRDLYTKVEMVQSADRPTGYAINLQYVFNGVNRTIDISRPDVLLDTSIPPSLKPVIQSNIGNLTNLVSQVSGLDQALSQVNTLDKVAFEKGFGANTYDQFVRSGNNWGTILRANYSEGSDTYEEFDDKLDQMRNLSNDIVAAIRTNPSQLIQNLTTEFQLERAREIQSRGSGGTYDMPEADVQLYTLERSSSVRRLIEVATKVFNIPMEELQPIISQPNQVGIQNIIRLIANKTSNGQELPYTANTITHKSIPDEFNNLVEPYVGFITLQRKGDSKFKNYLDTFNDHWRLGVDANGAPLGGTNNVASDEGIRQSEKTLFSLNINSTVAGERYESNMSNLVSSVLSADMLNAFDFNTNKQIDPDLRARMLSFNKQGKPNYTVSGITFDDEGTNLVLTVHADIEQGLPPRTVEIRGQGPVLIQNLQNLGIGIDQRIMNSANEMLKGFLTENPSPSQDFGQKRSNPVSMINTGLVQLPVTRAVVRQQLNGQMIEEGTFIYKSPYTGEVKTSVDPIEITKLAYQDAVQLERYMSPLEFQTVDVNTYSNIKVNQPIIDNGKNTSTRAVGAILDRINAFASKEGRSLTITSLTRSGNGGGAHTLGDAVDLRIIDASNNIDHNIVGTINRAVTDWFSIPAVQPLYDVILELPSNYTEAQLNEIKSKYPGSKMKFVINPEATGPHIHIEFNRTRIR
jgi:hypothetical protein